MPLKSLTLEDTKYVIITMSDVTTIMRMKFITKKELDEEYNLRIQRPEQFLVKKDYGFTTRIPDLHIIRYFGDYYKMPKRVRYFADEYIEKYGFEQE